jgi:hypothetical protein
LQLAEAVPGARITAVEASRRDAAWLGFGLARDPFLLPSKLAVC